TSARDPAGWIGWVDAPFDADRVGPELTRLVAELDAEGVTDAVLVGMGGSSLYAEVLERLIGPATGAPRLWILDSTDPAALLRLERELPWSTTVVIAASKSGTTIEVTTLLERLLERLTDAHGAAAGRWVVALTDPGSPLADLAAARGFRAVVLGRTDVGGRYSALTVFGLLPAALLGVDPLTHVDPARRRLEVLRAATAGEELEEVATIAAVLAAAVGTGRDKVALVSPPSSRPIGPWLEQLIAESLGKGGRGPLPVLDEDLDAVRGTDRAVIALGRVRGLDAARAAGIPVLVLDAPTGGTLAATVLAWELAVAAAGVALGVDPFDQPDVAAAKAATARVLAAGTDLAAPGDARALVAGLGVGEHLAVLAYVDPHGPTAAALEGAVQRLRARVDAVVTLGIGPRYLHSTGQAHKGGAPSGRFLVVVGDDPEDVVVPGPIGSLSRLKRAQAAGDAEALAALGRPVVVTTPAAVLELV
ncbi:MAG: Glucose-6-phosphate isomerase, partial [Actinomycetota bacterium]